MIDDNICAKHHRVTRQGEKLTNMFKIIYQTFLKFK
jgi:hypothetical protein